MAAFRRFDNPMTELLNDSFCVKNNRPIVSMGFFFGSDFKASDLVFKPQYHRFKSPFQNNTSDFFCFLVCHMRDYDVIPCD